eukprot:Hpha_TRINITY_DN15008_c2_g1::TRINITY_DN15008_c2_g1_i1::g.123836::m.123836
MNSVDVSIALCVVGGILVAISLAVLSMSLSVLRAARRERTLGLDLERAVDPEAPTETPAEAPQQTPGSDATEAVLENTAQILIMPPLPLQSRQRRSSGDLSVEVPEPESPEPEAPPPRPEGSEGLLMPCRQVSEMSQFSIKTAVSRLSRDDSRLSVREGDVLSRASSAGSTDRIDRKESYASAPRGPVRSPSMRGLPNSAVSFKRGELIGSGAYGRVYVAMNDQGQLIAVKNVMFDTGDPLVRQRLTQLQSEVALLKAMSHPNVVCYLGTNREGNSINILMEYVPGGSVARLLSQYGPLQPTVVKMYAWQILQGLDYLHKALVVHRDVKGQNVLISAEGVAKLSDFGSAGILDEIQWRKSVKGTPAWMAPEVISQQGHSWQCDIWSLGCTTLEMLTASHPFQSVVPEGSNHMALLMYIIDDERPIEYPFPAGGEMRELLDTCLQRKPENRPSASQLLELDLFKDVGFWSDESDGMNSTSRSELNSTMRSDGVNSTPSSRPSSNPPSMMNSPCMPAWHAGKSGHGNRVRCKSGSINAPRPMINDDGNNDESGILPNTVDSGSTTLGASRLSISSGTENSDIIRQGVLDTRRRSTTKTNRTSLTTMSPCKMDINVSAQSPLETGTRSNPLSTPFSLESFHQHQF